MTSYQPTRAGLTRHLPGRPIAITALQVAFLAWAGVELAEGRVGNAVALVATFAVLQVPRLLRLPLLFDVAFLVAWTRRPLPLRRDRRNGLRRGSRAGGRCLARPTAPAERRRTGALTKSWWRDPESLCRFDFVAAYSTAD